MKIHIQNEREEVAVMEGGGEPEKMSRKFKILVISNFMRHYYIFQEIVFPSNIYGATNTLQ